MSNPMEKHIIVGVHITERVKHASQVQQCLTEFGCNIKTRLGLHEVDEKFCSPNGVLLLEMVGDEGLIDQMQEKLNTIKLGASSQLEYWNAGTME